MQAKPEFKTVKELLELRANAMLSVNQEYQRGAVWTVAQKKRLVDSVLRGYPIPLIYLHHLKKSVGKITNENFDVIDGQQRINALYDYHEGAFKLFDLTLDEEEAKFPAFIKDMDCPWGRKSFDELGADVQKQFLDTPLAVVLVETDVPNEARDLFIRLQAGMPLNSQEKRDAWPGNFTEFILKAGGKPQLSKYPGHEFFSKIMKAKEKNRGEFRQFCAQMVMLFFARRDTNGEQWCDINREAIDTFYYKHLNFDMNGGNAKRFHEILTLLTQLLGDGKRKKVIGHEAMHLVMLVDTLLDGYTRSWTANFAAAFDDFRLSLAQHTAARLETQGEYWVRYGQFTRANSDRAAIIQHRHQFFAEKMHAVIEPVMKDSTRAYGPLEREVIYFRDKKRCQVCDTDVLWDDVEVHHVEEHSKGGKTVLSNGALVHKACHPKGAKQTAEFAEKWKLRHAAAPASVPTS